MGTIDNKINTKERKHVYLEHLIAPIILTPSYSLKYQRLFLRCWFYVNSNEEFNSNAFMAWDSTKRRPLDVVHVEQRRKFDVSPAFQWDRFNLLSVALSLPLLQCFYKDISDFGGLHFYDVNLVWMKNFRTLFKNLGVK